MQLEPKSGLTIDFDKRFRKGCQGLPREITLQGTAMYMAIAQRLLKKHRPHVTIGDGEIVQLMSLEQHTSAFLRSFIEGTEVPTGRSLLHTIPEELLIAYAKKHDIPVLAEEKSDVRKMVERIAKGQQQTFFSLARSMERMSEHLRVSKGDARKE